MKALKYREVQRFRDLSILGVLTLCFGGLLFKVFAGSPNFAECLLFLSVVGTAIAAFLSIRMETVIDKKGIRYQYFPLHHKKQKISWKEVDSVKVIDTPIVDELSGLNVNFTANKKYCTSTRNKGMEIKLTNGERIFIGSHKIDRLQSFLTTIGKL